MKGEMREVLYLEINILPQFITGLLFVTEITEMRRGGGGYPGLYSFLD